MNIFDIPKPKSNNDVYEQFVIGHITKYGTRGITIAEYKDPIVIIHDNSTLHTGFGSNSVNYLVTDTSINASNVSIKCSNADSYGVGHGNLPGHGTIYFMSDFSCISWHNTTNEFYLSKEDYIKFLPFIPEERISKYLLLATRYNINIPSEFIHQYPELFI